MLQVGNTGLSHREQVSHFALWCLITGPLLISTDLSSISKESLAILTASELVEINQDFGGVQGVRVSDADPTGVEVWAKPLHGGAPGAIAAVFLNRSPDTRDITASWAMLGIQADVSVDVRDLWLQEDIAVGVQNRFTANAVPSHGVLAAKFSPRTDR